MTDETITDIPIPAGRGPFALPALARFLDFQSAEDQSFAIARFFLEDGALVHVPILIPAAEEFLKAAVAWREFRVRMASTKNSPMQ